MVPLVLGLHGLENIAYFYNARQGVLLILRVQEIANRWHELMGREFLHAGVSPSRQKRLELVVLFTSPQDALLDIGVSLYF
jgi:hypothetical protein